MVQSNSVAIVVLVAAIMVPLIGMGLTLVDPVKDEVTSQDSWGGSDVDDSIRQGQRTIAALVSSLALIFVVALGMNIIYRSREGL